MANIKKWLKEKGYTFRQVTMTNGTKGIMVDTNAVLIIEKADSAKSA